MNERFVKAKARLAGKKKQNAAPQKRGGWPPTGKSAKKKFKNHAEALMAQGPG